MGIYSLSSPYTRRIRSYDCAEEFTFKINSKELKLPLTTAICLSDIVEMMYKTDRSATELNINVGVKNAESIDLFYKLLEGCEINICDNYADFLVLGKAIGNSDIVKLSFKQMEDSLSPQTVLDLISLKCASNLQVDSEISYAAAHLAEMPFFVEWAVTVDTEIVERILRSTDLQIESEDSLIDLIIKMCRKKKECEYLFSVVMLEYATVEGIQRFCSYISTHEVDGATFALIWQPIANRLQLQLADRPKKIARHIKPEREGHVFAIDKTNNRNGILVNLFEEKKVSVTASSKASGDYMDVISGNDDARFFTEHDTEAWIQVMLENSSVLPTSYMIRGSNYADDDNQLQTWSVKGLTQEGQWIVLDSHTNEPFHKTQVRTFEISSDVELVGFRLERTGLTTSGGKRLCVSQFEVFGTLFNNKPE